MPAPARACELLATGDIEVLGLLPYSSNYVFLAKVNGQEGEALAVYKPSRGERPLWDFPAGTLAAREVAAYLVSEAAGWGFVPPTVMRPDGPLGRGSMQLFVEHDPERHYFVLVQERLEEFASIALFDAVINNADRKGGHILEDAQGRMWVVDHGLCFSVADKLRTVIWAFSEEPIGGSLRDRLLVLGTQLADDRALGGRLAELLSPRETAATLARVEELLIDDRFPAPEGDRPLPWPLV
ncbi:MAG: SCO1664 family protein [Actinobacteria bacterium]|nr:SCO1664 family protein [Actinomycetota bacterium]